LSKGFHVNDQPERLTPKEWGGVANLKTLPNEGYAHHAANLWIVVDHQEGTFVPLCVSLIAVD